MDVNVYPSLWWLLSMSQRGMCLSVNLKFSKLVYTLKINMTWISGQSRFRGIYVGFWFFTETRHNKTLQNDNLFGVIPRVFRNTESHRVTQSHIESFGWKRPLRPWNPTIHPELLGSLILSFSTISTHLLNSSKDGDSTIAYYGNRSSFAVFDCHTLKKGPRFSFLWRIMQGQTFPCCKVWLLPSHNQKFISRGIKKKG